MRLKSLLAIAVISGVAAGAPLGAAVAAPDDMGHAPGGKRIRITYENLTAGQTFSPSVFFSHNAAAPTLFTEGQPASFGVMRMAEEGNPAPLADAAAATVGGAFGAYILGGPVLPGKSRTVELDVDPAHPMISGVFMLGRTNDGFTGVNGVAALGLSHAVRMDLYAYDAGTEKNNERGDDLFALRGTGRDPEHGVVRRHTGLRGDADAPGTWKFDPSRPVARITIAPAGR